MAKPDNRVSATIKMTLVDDADLIEWWQSVPLGARNAVMKDMMRDYIRREQGNYRPPVNKFEETFVLNNRQIIQIQKDTLWIRNALMDMPAYLEKLLQQVASIQPVARSPEAAKEAVKEDVQRLRASRLEAKSW